MQKSKKILFILILFITLFFIGYYREIFFLVINSVIDNEAHPYNVSYIKVPKFLYNYSTNYLLVLKWLLTFLFSFVLMGVTMLMVNIYFKQKVYITYTLFIYLLVIIIAFLLYVVGVVFHLDKILYPLSRGLMGIVQSPIMSLIIIFVFYLRESIKK